VTILAVRLVGDPVLRTAADPVTRFDGALLRLSEDMHQTMDEVNGVGLAGPQVGAGLRIFTYNVDGQRGTVCNPVVDVSPGEGLEPDGGSEGCLSVPGLGFPLARSAAVRLTGQDEHGEPLEIEATGLLARCFQHETDHLDGTLYVDKLAGEERKRAWKLIRESGFSQHANKVAAERSGAVGSAFGGAAVTSSFGGTSFGRNAS